MFDRVCLTVADLLIWMFDQFVSCNFVLIYFVQLLHCFDMLLICISSSEFVMVFARSGFPWFVWSDFCIFDSGFLIWVTLIYFANVIWSRILLMWFVWSSHFAADFFSPQRRTCGVHGEPPDLSNKRFDINTAREAWLGDLPICQQDFSPVNACNAPWTLQWPP